MSTISTNYEAAKGAIYSTFSKTGTKLSALKDRVVENAPILYSSAKETTISTLSSVKEALQNTDKETRKVAAATLALGIYSYANRRATFNQIEALSSKIDSQYFDFFALKVRYTEVLPNFLFGALAVSLITKGF